MLRFTFRKKLEAFVFTKNIYALSIQFLMYNFYHSIKQANTSVSAAGKPLRAMLPYIMTKQLVFLCSLANK